MQERGLGMTTMIDTSDAHARRRTADRNGRGPRDVSLERTLAKLDALERRIWTMWILLGVIALATLARP